MTDQTIENAPARIEANPMGLIQMAVEQNADPDRLEKLMALQERWQANCAAEAFADAVAAFQAECPQIKKARQINLGGGQGPSYASIDDIMQQVQPLLTRHGLSVAYSADIAEGGKLHATCTIRKGSHREVSNITLPVPQQMKVNDTQKMGAALSYAKRYALCAALNITVTDQDRDAGGLEQTVGPGQIAEINARLEKLEPGTRARFLAWLGVERVEDIPAARYPQAIGNLDAKVKAEAKAWGAAE